jgi:RNA polymerase sigma-70 factor, ECF subfamily
MSSTAPPLLCDRTVSDGIADEEVVERVRAGDSALYEILMRRYNQRLYRVAFSILPNHAEAEDVMQEAFINAYQHLDQFAGKSKFSTWLTTITINEALGHVRRSRQTISGALSLDANLHIISSLKTEVRDPERQAHDHELKLALQHAVDSLPNIYRSVFVLRAIEGLSAAETAACLGIGKGAMKSRFHRALRMLRKLLWARRSGSQHGKTGGSAIFATRRVHGEALNGKARCDSHPFTPLKGARAP